MTKESGTNNYKNLYTLKSPRKRKWMTIVAITALEKKSCLLIWKRFETDLLSSWMPPLDLWDETDPWCDFTLIRLAAMLPFQPYHTAREDVSRRVGSAQLLKWRWVGTPELKWSNQSSFFPQQTTNFPIYRNLEGRWKWIRLLIHSWCE